MILYSGSGNCDMVVIDLLGDGETKIVEMELTKPPFNLLFTGVFPRHWVVRMQDGEAPSIVSMQGSRLHLEFAEPLPPPNEGTASPRTKMEFYMWYNATGSRRRHGTVKPQPIKQQLTQKGK